VNRSWGQLAAATVAGVKHQSWGQLAAVGLAVLGVVIIASLKPTGADLVEVVWTSLGAGGSVYAWQIWRRRVAMDRWRKANHVNGLFAITSQQHAVLRGVGFWIQVCIAAAGLGAMFNLNRLLIIGLLIAVAGLCTLSAWYAERKAEQASQYIHLHQED
jgi:hypothetical protein